MEPTRSELFQKAWDEVSDPPPRRIHLRPLGEVKTLWAIFLVLFLCDLFILCYVVFWLQGPFFSAQYGQPAQGMVEKLSTYTTKGIRHYVVHLGYDFQGNHYEGRSDNVGSLPTELSVGQTVPIHCLAWFMSTPAIDAHPPHDYSAALYFLPVIVIALVLFFLTLSNRRLLKLGKAYVGRIENPRNPLGGRVTVDGNEYPVRISTRGDADRYFVLEKDAKIIVLVDPENPRKNRIYSPAACFYVPEK
jgi:hypothetical protein